MCGMRAARSNGELSAIKPNTATSLPKPLGLRYRTPISALLLRPWRGKARAERHIPFSRSEEHTSELQSRENLVCRLLLEKKKKYQQHLSQYNKKKLQHNNNHHLQNN